MQQSAAPVSEEASSKSVPSRKDARRAWAHPVVAARAHARGPARRACPGLVVHGAREGACRHVHRERRGRHVDRQQEASAATLCRDRREVHVGRPFSGRTWSRWRIQVPRRGAGDHRSRSSLRGHGAARGHDAQGCGCGCAFAGNALATAQAQTHPASSPARSWGAPTSSRQSRGGGRST